MDGEKLARPARRHTLFYRCGGYDSSAKYSRMAAITAFRGSQDTVCDRGRTTSNDDAFLVNRQCGQTGSHVTGNCSIPDVLEMFYNCYHYI